MSCSKSFILLFLVLILSGCATLRYYTQAVSGQLEILTKRRSIESVLQDPATGAALRGKLEAVLRIRDFAAQALALPDSGSFRHYVDVGRPHVLWNVFATPELSLQPKRWCYPLFGCISYRAFFVRDRAFEFAAQLRDQGLDVYVGGVNAYSTLGWFDDPVYSPVAAYTEAELAGILFHELAHERLYIRDATAFNESFAMVVQLEGTRRWLEHSGRGEDYHAYARRRRFDREFVDYLLGYRERLAKLYASDLPDAGKRAAKRRILDELRAGYARLRASWDGHDAYDGWFREEPNNARLAPVGTYYRYTAALRNLLTLEGGDFAAFYTASERIGNLPPGQRGRRLQALRPAPGTQED